MHVLVMLPDFFGFILNLTHYFVSINEKTINTNSKQYLDTDSNGAAYIQGHYEGNKRSKE